LFCGSQLATLEQNEMKDELGASDSGAGISRDVWDAWRSARKDVALRVLGDQWTHSTSA
jgi:hypothetical protein